MKQIFTLTISSSTPLTAARISRLLTEALPAVTLDVQEIDEQGAALHREPQPPAKIKLDRSPDNRRTAWRILDWIAGRSGKSIQDPVLAVEGRQLLFMNAAAEVAKQDGVSVLIDRVTVDSFGDGWSSCNSSEAMLKWIEDHCAPEESDG